MKLETDNSKETDCIFRKQYESVFNEPVNTLRIDDPAELFRNKSPPATDMSEIYFAPSHFEKANECMPIHSLSRPGSWILPNFKTREENP